MPDVVEDYDPSYRRLRDSLVAKLPREAGTVPLPAGASLLEAPFGTPYHLSNSAMTPLIGGSLERLGYERTVPCGPREPGACAAPGRRPAAERH
ncbi:hypothetical protein AB4068_11330 [Arthrobacter sp. 2RAF22]|uniref:hypothetical protein n=1 Tax=Arthrobacter sp. 2RAF22 TaxID=3232996 RepID=UPI003F8DEB11